MTSAFPHRYGHELLRRRPRLAGLVEDPYGRQVNRKRAQSVMRSEGLL
jgi:hypothetical protein